MLHFIKENNPNCHVLLSSPIDRLDDGKAALTIKRLNCLLLDSTLDIINNSKIGHSFLEMHGPCLNENGAGRLALNFVKRIKSILNFGSVKQKLKEVHSKISALKGQATTQDLTNLSQFMPHCTTGMRKL